MAGLAGRQVMFLVAPEGVEQVELTEPWAAVEAAGGIPRLVSTRGGKIQAFNHLDRGDTFPVDATVEEVSANEFAGLVLPGGVANPDMLRLSQKAVGLVRSFFVEGLPVAAICHAPWILAEADVVRGRRMTSWPSLRTDLTNAGAEWVDEPLVVCEGAPSTLVTSRNPDDLPVFCPEVVRRLSA